MIQRREMDGLAFGFMVLLCIIWGLQQIAIKAAAPEMSPLLQIALRSGLAALMVAFYLRIKAMRWLPARGYRAAGLIAGLLFTLEYLFVAEGLRFTNASRMVTMLYTSPAFAALGLYFLVPEERLKAGQWGGLALAFCGIAVAFHDGVRATGAGQAILWGDFLGLLGGISWGATTVVIRTKLTDVPAAQTTFIQLLVCFCLLLPGAALTGRACFTMSDVVRASLIYQTLLVSFISMLAWFWLLRVYPASKLGALSFLTPVFGIIFGVLLLNEPLEPKFILGSALVLAGVALVSGWQWLEQRFRNHDTNLTIKE